MRALTLEEKQLDVRARRVQVGERDIDEMHVSKMTIEAVKEHLTELQQSNPLDLVLMRQNTSDSPQPL